MSGGKTLVSPVALPLLQIRVKLERALVSEGVPQMRVISSSLGMASLNVVATAGGGGSPPGSGSGFLTGAVHCSGIKISKKLANNQLRFLNL